MEKPTPYLFVYSSLRKGFNSSNYDYVSKYFDYVGEAHVRGKLLENVDHPVGLPTTDDFFIEGELYKLQDTVPFDYVIEQLDDYEGINVDEDNTFPLYRREIVVANHAGQNYEAWVYWYNADISGFPQLNDTDVISYFKRKNS